MLQEWMERGAERWEYRQKGGAGMRHPFKQQRGSPEREGGGWEGPEGAGVGVLCHFQAEPPEETAPEGSYVPGVFAEQ